MAQRKRRYLGCCLVCFRPLWSLIPGAAAPMKAARPSAAASCPKTWVPQPRMTRPSAAASCLKTPGCRSPDDDRVPQPRVLKTRVPQPRMEFAWPGAAAPCPKTLVDDTFSCAFGAGGGRLPLTYWRHNEELRWG